MDAIKVSLSAFYQAHKIIWKDNILSFLKIPILLTISYFPIMLGICYFLAPMIVDFILDHFPSHAVEGGWLEWTLEVLLFLLVGFLGFISYRTVVLIFYSFFLDDLAEKVELSIGGKKADYSRSTMQLLKRVIVVFIITILGTIGLLIVDLLANIIPVIGGVAALVLIFPIEMFLIGIGFIDPYFDRAGLTGMESFRLMRKHFLTIVVFSVFGNLILLIPIAGWILGPTYSVVAGIIIALGIKEKDVASISAHLRKHPPNPII